MVHGRGEPRRPRQVSQAQHRNTRGHRLQVNAAVESHVETEVTDVENVGMHAWEADFWDGSVDAEVGRQLLSQEGITTRCMLHSISVYV